MAEEILLLKSKYLILIVLTLALFPGRWLDVSAQSKASKFYSTYSVPDTVKRGAYKGIDCDYGGSGFETETELRDGGSEKDKSDSYSCKVGVSGNDQFNPKDFLIWLAKETEQQIKKGGGSLGAQESKEGEWFHINYEEEGFQGSVDVKAKYMGKDWLSLDVGLKESSHK